MAEISFAAQASRFLAGVDLAEEVLWLTGSGLCESEPLPFFSTHKASAEKMLIYVYSSLHKSGSRSKQQQMRVSKMKQIEDETHKGNLAEDTMLR